MEEFNVCEFCGQVMISGNCNCDKAAQKRKIEEQIIKAKDAIIQLFDEPCEKLEYKPVSEEIITMLNDIAEQIARHKIHAAALVLSRGTKAKLTHTSAGAIKIERIEVDKNALSVND